MSKTRVWSSFFAVALLAIGAHASTVTINGAVWAVNSVIAQHALLEWLPATPPNITFTFTTSSELMFASSTDQSAYAFFESGGVPANAFVGPDMPFSNALTLFTVNNFTLLHNTSFTVGHDDGASFYINGVRFYVSPGPTTFNEAIAQYTGPTVIGGTLQMVYGECCQPPAILETDLPTGGVPEPSTLLLFGPALLGVVTVFRRKTRS